MGIKGFMGVTDHEFGHNWFPMWVQMNVYSLGWMKDSILSLIHYHQYFNGEYKAEPIDLHQRAETLTGSDLETIMSSPDNMKEANIVF
jgi:hypothetical protein